MKGAGSRKSRAGRPSQAAQSETRRPTYGAATRLARLILELMSRPFGWSFDSIQRELGISERTLLRYLAVCKRELVDSSGNPEIEVAQHERRRVVRMVRHPNTPNPTDFEAASLYFTFTMLRFLKGTVLREMVDEVWDKVRENIPESDRFRLADFDRKFYAVSYAPKDYSKHDEDLDVILRALLRNQRLNVDYAGLAGEGHQHNFDPYTLIAYRGGLYLLGRSDVYDRVIYLAVERIRSVKFLRGVDGKDQKFSYPRNYRPDTYLNGVFGLIDGPETRVELLLHGDTEALLRSRVIHPSQQFHRRSDNSTVLPMTVKGTTALKNWFLSMGPWIEVLKPAEMRAEVADLLGRASSLYAEPRKRRR